MAGVTRRFGRTLALDGADLELAPGEVHGVLGENGAGKTTLLNVLAGMLVPDAGRIEIDGEPVRFHTPRDAWGRGVAMVHQHFKLVDPLTVLENLALGRRQRGHGLRLPYAELRERLDALVARTGLAVEPDRVVGTLAVGERQRVEILKALLRDPRVLILDEPTAVLTPPEADALFALLRELARDGRTVVLVAHKLDEVLAVADRVTVLRRGRTVFSVAAAATGPEELVREMVGAEAPAVLPPAPGSSHAAAGSGATGGPAVGAPGTGPAPSRAPGAGADPVARLEGVGVRRGGALWALHNATLEVFRGEIVGIAGVEGNGQRELALVLAGRLAPDAGRATLPPRIGFIPQDRTVEGLALDLDLVENVALAFHDREAGPWMPWRALRSRTAELVRRYDVRGPGPLARAGALSGGNQQKLVVGRELAVAGDLLVAENPTRGLDVGAAAFVWDELRRVTRGEGALERAGAPPGVVLVTADLEEALALSDRLFVLARGRLHPVPPERRSRSGLGELMLAAAT